MRHSWYVQNAITISPAYIKRPWYPTSQPQRNKLSEILRYPRWMIAIYANDTSDSNDAQVGGRHRRCKIGDGERRAGWRAETGRVRERVKPSAHVAKARVSPASPWYIWRASICRSPLIWQHLHTAYSLWAIYSLANSPLLAFGHQCVWLTLLVAPLTPDYISICIHSRTSLIPREIPTPSHSMDSCFLFFFFFSYLYNLQT